MKRLEIPIGTKFGRLTILKQVESKIQSRGTKMRMVQCKCDCGNIKDYSFQYLTKGHTKSCGCYMKDRTKETNTTHSDTINKSMTPEYRTWRAMKQRCNNPKNNRWEHYGGRGINVCNRWINSFENFILDMGRKPSSEYTIDRIDVDGNYEPNNCRWATPSQQNENQRRWKDK
jgi:hypothetical protein